ncbi:unnamed protein product, partial [Adineta ricciae]
MSTSPSTVAAAAAYALHHHHIHTHHHIHPFHHQHQLDTSSSSTSNAFFYPSSSDSSNDLILQQTDVKPTNNNNYLFATGNSTISPTDLADRKSVSPPPPSSQAPASPINGAAWPVIMQHHPHKQHSLTIEEHRLPQQQRPKA